MTGALRVLKGSWRTLLLLACVGGGLLGCGADAPDGGDSSVAAPAPADLVLMNAGVYTLAWSDPDEEGRPAADAPLRDGTWLPDAAAIAIRDGLIVAVGQLAEILPYAPEARVRSGATRLIDVSAYVVPGLVESHGHYNELGEQAERVDVSDADTVEAMARRLEPRVADAASARAGGCTPLKKNLVHRVPES